MYQLKNLSLVRPYNMKVALYVLVILFIILEFFNSCNSGNLRANGQVAEKDIRLKDMFGVNVYEWNFLQDSKSPALGSNIFEPKMALIKTFSGVRHYMDWEKIEDSPGNYTFNPTRRGGWNYDAIYQRCKQDGILVLACLKEAPDWLYNTYPEGQRDANNVPHRPPGVPVRQNRWKEKRVFQNPHRADLYEGFQDLLIVE